LGQAVLELSTDTSKLDSGLKTTSSQLTRTGNAITSGLTQPLLAAGPAIAAAAAGFVSFRTITGAISATQELGLAVAKLSRETGLSSEASSQLLFAFKHFGLGADDASRSIGIFAKKLKGVSDEETGVTTGGKSMGEILADIGIKATDASGNIKPMMDILLPLADQFKAMPNGLEKTGLAMQLFGRSGKDMIPLLNAGSEGLKELSAEADKLGVTLTGDNVASIKAYTFAQRDMNEAIAGVKMQIGMALMPALTSVATGFTDVQPRIREFTSSLIEGFQNAADAVKPFLEALTPLASSLSLVAAAALTAGAAFALTAIAGFIAPAVAYATALVGLAASEGVAGAASIAFGDAMATTLGPIALVVGALVALDQVARKFTGAGIISLFRGTQNDAKNTASAIKDVGSATDLLTEATKEGMTAEQAHAAVMQYWIGLAGQMKDEADRLAASLPGAFRSDIYDALTQRMKLLADQVMATNPTMAELRDIIAQVPALAEYLNPQLEKMASDFLALHPEVKKFDEVLGGSILHLAQLPGALILLAAGLDATGGASQRAADDFAAYLTDVKSVGTAVTNLSDVVIAKLGLSLEQLQLERRKNELEALGKAAPAGELDAVNARLDAMGKYLTDVSDEMKILGQRLFEALGPDASAKIEAITKQLFAMPTEMMIQVLPLLDALAANQIVRFMDMLASGVTIPIAFAVAKFNMPTMVTQVPGIAGDYINKMLTQFGQLAAATLPATKGVSDFQGAVSGAGGASEKAKEVVDILADGTITLAEATANGIPAWAAARFEMAATTAELTTGEKAWRNQIDLLKLFYACIDAGVTPALLGFTVLMAAAKGDTEALNTELGKFLDDGVISLAEAVRANLNPAQQAQLELVNARTQAEKDAAEAANRYAVEQEKLKQSYGTVEAGRFWEAAKLANEGTLNLAETLKLGLAPAQGAAIQAFSDEIAAHEALKQSIWGVMVDIGLFAVQLQDIPGYAQAGVRELYNLGLELGVDGLGRKALDFELAMQEVNTSFGEGRDAAAQFAYGVGTELVSSLQSALGQLLSGPTVETANLQLSIDTLQYQLALQEAAGATQEQTQGIRDQIAALQAQQAVYTAEHRVMQDRATLADQTLPTERELKDMVATITTNIGIYSGKVNDLTWATGIHTLATANAVKQTDTMSGVIGGATDYLGFFTRKLGDSAGTVTDKNLALAGSADYAQGLTRGVGDAMNYAGPKTWNLGDAAGHAAWVLNSLQIPQGFQSGGITSGFSLVGEQGTELIYAPPNTRVFSHGDTERLLSLAGGASGGRANVIDVDLTVNVVAATGQPADVGRQVGEVASRVFVQALRAKGVIP
jgi:hypothetical protein